MYLYKFLVLNEKLNYFNFITIPIMCTKIQKQIIDKFHYISCALNLDWN